MWDKFKDHTRIYLKKNIFSTHYVSEEYLAAIQLKTPNQLHLAL